ncbi:MAG: F0F1 ATP synthase subunit B [Ignavibacteriae bacterium]|nr:F0F1 ATP synthase subunit B [Ignavibacteria bacterium]MBI3365380.1 F0F1 ATP synthase subunit B [Ignavibacteriota bacterium]
MLEPNPGLIVWTIITFVLLVLILRKFAWRPILESLHKREEYVRTSIERAEQARQEAERLLEEHRKQIAQAEHEGHRILNESRALAEKLKQEIMDKANQQSRRMVEQAKQEIDRDKEAALVELRGEVASLAVQAASKILGETLDENKHRKIVDAYLKDLPKN